MTDPFDPLLRTLDDLAQASTPARFWLRDDDAVNPTPALDRLLALGAEHAVPLTLAVIPQPTGRALADRLQGLAVEVAPHGWSHVNHAGPGAKSCELVPTRPAAQVLADLSRGLAHLGDLHGPRLVPVLVPPWNRIAPELIPLLPGAGFQGLSVFGPEKGPRPPQRINAHVDLIDWRGTRGGRDPGALVADLVARLTTAVQTGTRQTGTQQTGTRQTGAPIGFLTHHLVHDAAAWAFIERLFALTTAHPGAGWHRLTDLLRDLRAADQAAVV